MKVCSAPRPDRGRHWQTCDRWTDTDYRGRRGGGGGGWGGGDSSHSSLPASVSGAAHDRRIDARAAQETMCAIEILRAASAAHDQPTTNGPPFAAIVAPVMKPALSLARKATHLAISSALPTRPTGMGEGGRGGGGGGGQRGGLRIALAPPNWRRAPPLPRLRLAARHPAL